MAESYVTQVELRTNVEKVLERLKETQDQMDKLEGKEYKINLGIDTKTLESVIQKLDKMLNSLGKGTGDFKQLESLSKQLESITSDVRDFSKAFGKVDDSGAKTLLSSIQNIDKSLSELSQNILNVNKNMSNMGGNTSGAVKQVENITNESKKAASALEDVAKAQAKVNGQKTNISLGDASTTSAEKFQQITNDTVNVLSDVGKTEDQIVQKIQKERAEAEANNEVLREHLVLLDKAGKVVANHWGSTSNVNGTYTEEQLSQAQGGKIIHAHPGKASFFGGKDLQHLLQDSMYDQIKQIELIWGDSTLSVDKSTLTKQSSSTILNIMRNVRKALTEAYGDNQDGTPAREAREHINAIEKEIFKSIAQKLNVSVTEDGSMAKEVTDSLSDVDKAIIKRFSEIKASVVQDVDASSIIKNTMKDAFQSKNSNQKSQEIKKNLEAVAQSENKARQEAIKTDKAINNINFVPNTEGFDEIVSKFKLLREEAEQIVKITKTTRQAVDGTFSTSYTAKLKNGSTYNLDGNRQSQMSSANEVIYNSAEREKQIWEELSSELNRYATLQKKIARGTALESEKNEANELLKTIYKLQRSDILSPEKLNASNKKLSQIRQSFKDIQANVEKNTTKSFQSKIETAISNAQKKYDEYSARAGQKDFHPSANFTSTLSTLNSQIDKLKEKAEAFSKTEITTKEQRNEVEELIQTIEKTETALKNMPAAAKGVNNMSIEKVIDRINKLLEDNSRFSRAAKKELKGLITLAESGSASANVITTRMLEIKNAEVAAGRAGKSFFDIFKSKTFYGFIGQVQSYLSMYVGFYGMVHAARNTITTITELDTALVDLKKTTSMNTTELNQFYFDSNKVAKQMGVTTQEIINQASAWSRLNKIGLLYGDI